MFRKRRGKSERIMHDVTCGRHLFPRIIMMYFFNFLRLWNMFKNSFRPQNECTIIIVGKIKERN